MKMRVVLLLAAISFAINLVLLMRAPDWWMVPAALAGWYCADAMSGLVHMYMDYRPCRSGIGLDRLYFYAGSRESDEYVALRDRTLAQLNPFERLVFDFKNHHPRPDALGRRSLVTLIGSTVAFAALPFSVLLNLAGLLLPVPGWLMAGGVTFLLGSIFAQYFHGSLHRADNPAVVRLLRRARLLMRPEDHGRHHATLRYDFSTINGWSNPLLNLLFATLHRRGMLTDHGLEPN